MSHAEQSGWNQVRRLWHLLWNWNHDPQLFHLRSGVHGSFVWLRSMGTGNQTCPDRGTKTCPILVARSGHLFATPGHVLVPRSKHLFVTPGHAFVPQSGHLLVTPGHVFRLGHLFVPRILIERETHTQTDKRKKSLRFYSRHTFK